MRLPVKYLALLCGVLAAAPLAPASAFAQFGLRTRDAGFSVAMTRSGNAASQAGSHPDQLEAHMGFNQDGAYTDGDLRELRLTMPAGMLANPASVPECSAAEFATPRTSPYEASLSGESCRDESQIGVLAVHTGPNGENTRYFGLFNLAAPYGSALAIGASPYGIPVVLTGNLDTGAATVSLSLRNLSQSLDFSSLDITIWGTPWEYVHDVERGNCLNELEPSSFHGTASFYEDGVQRREPGGRGFHPGTCFIPLSIDHIYSYLTLPTTCGATMNWTLAVSSWQGGSSDQRTIQSRGSGGQPVTIGGCLGVLAFSKLQLRTERAASATGLVYSLEVKDGGGLLNVEGDIRSPIKSARALLPEGLTINPSLGAGLGTCSEADFARESATSEPGSGCPNNSKIGNVSADGLLGLGEQLQGSVFLATPYRNPSNSLIALYITLASSRRGLYFKSYGTIEPDPASGRLTATFENLPPIHYDTFTLSLREGQRSAMISPPACGSYTAEIESHAYSQQEVVQDSSHFLINSDETGGPCPSGSLPFHPGLEAGSTNPNAGRFSPFLLRMTRTDSEQEITSYSASFPPGLLGKIAGIPYCPEAAIAAAKSRTGLEELESPSCPEASRVGSTVAGYGVGGTLAYAPGALYLGGPFHGSPVSVVAIDSALVGPFDLGVVVVRSAIRVDPLTAQVSIDSSASDPIPHILKGIPLHLRDIRVLLDRPNFMVNPTSCEQLATSSLLSGAGARFGDPYDDSSATATNRYQLANCSTQEFHPRLSIALRGGTRRARYPSLRAVYRPRAEEGNVSKADVSLPASIFLAQEHLRGLCTTPEFHAHHCPRGSRLGHAAAVTPLLGEPLRGPVYLRSNPNALLPDLVAQLSGNGFEIEVVGHVGKSRRGGLRAIFENLPDAPVTRFTMWLAGGKHGLLQNERNLCSSPQSATGRFIAHDNDTAVLHPRLDIDCAKAHKRKGKR